MYLNFSKSTFLFCLLFLGLLPSCIAQSSNNSSLNNQNTYQIHVAKTEEKIRVDGNLEEKIWQTAEKVTGFTNKWPIVGGLATRQTEVRMTFDDQFLYVGVVCYDTSYYIIQSLKRDVGYWDSDGFAMVIDPVNTHSNGFFFGVNAYGAQTEGLIAQNAENNGNDWNDKWQAETKRYPNRWTIEYAIPFKTLRFEEGKRQWGVNFIRNDLKNFKYHIWSPVPQQFDGTDLNYTGALVWEDLPERKASSVSLIPYISGGVEHNIEEGKKPTAIYGFGGDAKVAVSSSLNLDLTFNPDFSQVEVDEQQTNLTRFSLFLPEKRNFFLENSDIFGEFGIPPLRPFFSRTIGLNSDGSRIPIWAGARLTGNLDEKTRIGLLNMQTASDGTNNPRNYTAATVQRRVLARSTIKALFLNRQGINDTRFNGNDFGREVGSEFLYVSENTRWSAWGTYHHSWKNDVKKSLANGYADFGGQYKNNNWTVLVDFLHCGDNYHTDMGFNQRINNYVVVNGRDTTLRFGWMHVFNQTSYNRPTPNSKIFSIYNVELSTFAVWNLNRTFNELSSNLDWTATLKNSGEVSVATTHNRVQLPYSIRLLGSDHTPLPIALYVYNNAKISYSSDVRKRFGYRFSANYGGFYNGTLLQLSAKLNYRVQPWGNFALIIEQNDIKLPTDYGSDRLILFGTRADISFSKNILWANYVQYNTQSSTFLINSRLQWRYKPMSDMYLVYTDNYLADTFASKYRALVFKMSYWF